MTFRAKVILTTVLMICGSVTASAALMATGFYRSLIQESELRAVALVDGVAQMARNDLAARSLQGIDEALSTLRGEQEGNIGLVFAVILDGHGRIITREVAVGYDFLSEHEFITRAGAAEIPLRSRINIQGHEILLVSKPVKTAVKDLPGIRWGTVVGGMDIGRVRASIIPLILRSVIVSVIFLAAFLTVMILLVRRGLILPVKQLAKAAEGFATGDLRRRAAITTNDEIGQLAATFNDMADEIQVQTEHLEETVKARTWELEKANSRLQELAATDELTGLGNRRTFQTSLKREVRRSQRDFSTFSLLMLDVDHFKHYNDTHGHPAGDAVLAKLGEIIRNRLRVTDIPCRYGGEEFAMLLITTDRAGAIEIAESIRARVEEDDFYGERQQPQGKLTVSIGVATYPDDAKDADLLVDAADIAMYAAKNQGRNQVVAFSPEMSAKFLPVFKSQVR